MEESYKFKNRTEYQKALDSVIMEKDVQERDLDKSGTKKHRYFPVVIKEAVADYIFQYWNVIDEKYNVIDGMLVCTIKLVYMPDYPTADELFCTGSAATLIQSNKNSLEYQLPAVESEAIGRALAKLGNIFGRNLARVLKEGIDIPDSFTLRGEKKEEKKQEQPKQTKKSEKTKKQNPDIPF